MSEFGDNTFKQRLLEYVECEAHVDKLNALVVIEEMLAVVAYFARTATKREGPIRDIYTAAKAEGRQATWDELRAYAKRLDTEESSDAVE